MFPNKTTARLALATAGFAMFSVAPALDHPAMAEAAHSGHHADKGKKKAGKLCRLSGPQTPRDIASKSGAQHASFPLAPAATQLNLCDIHFHKHAEHKGPGFSVFAGSNVHGGYKCNGYNKLTPAERKAPAGDICHGLKPGDTIEVHWVYSSCDNKPGHGLGSCIPKSCKKPVLRVESQVFLLVNDPKAASFDSYRYTGHKTGAHYQTAALPTGTGTPVVFHGSTTGPKYNNTDSCSPYSVTWSVRPNCAKLNIASLAKFCDGNIFEENHAHGVRQLVTDPKLLAEIRE